MSKLIKANLVAAQNRMKQCADKKRSKRQFEVGDWVYLKLQPYRQSSLVLRKNFKISTKYYGPFEGLSRVGLVAYKLKLPFIATIHLVFHVSLLRRR